MEINMYIKKTACGHAAACDPSTMEMAVVKRGSLAVLPRVKHHSTDPPPNASIWMYGCCTGCTRLPEDRRFDLKAEG